MTPGQKQMIAIRDLIRAEMDVRQAFGPDRIAETEMLAEVAFDQLCEAFGHEVPAE